MMTDVFKQKHPSVLYIKKWMQQYPQLIAGFSTRVGGYSHKPYDSLNLGLHVHDDSQLVDDNRKLFSEIIGVPLTNWVCSEQVHGTRIRVATTDDMGKGIHDMESALQSYDGIITNEKNMLCTAYFADCVPLFYFDSTTNYVGIAHAGWKGTVNQIASKMVATFQQLGVKPENLSVVIGPCISQANYEVDERIISQIDEHYQTSSVMKKANNRNLLNLKQLNVEILLQSGVLRHNIDITKFCTYEDKHLFFSHRRDKGQTGRMLGFIGLFSR